MTVEQETNTMIETINDAMTAEDLASAVSKFKAVCGPRACVHLSIGLYSGQKARATLSVRPTGEYSGNAPYFTFEAVTWGDIFTAAYEWAASYGTVRRNAIVRRMALAVIEVTDEHGTCTETLLRGKDFAAAEIVEFHEAACIRAGEMCSGAPFSVVFAAETRGSV